MALVAPVRSDGNGALTYAVESNPYTAITVSGDWLNTNEVAAALASARGCPRMLIEVSLRSAIAGRLLPPVVSTPAAG